MPRFGLDLQACLARTFERRGTWKNDFGLADAQLAPAAYKLVLDEPRQERVRRAGSVSMGLIYLGGASKDFEVH